MDTRTGLEAGDGCAQYASLAKRIIAPFRDKQSGGIADLGEDAWWVEDMLDRIERAITPYLAPPQHESEETDNSR